MFFLFFFKGTKNGNSRFSTTQDGNGVFRGLRVHHDTHRQILRRATRGFYPFMFKRLYGVLTICGSVTTVGQVGAHGRVGRYKFTNTITTSGHCRVTFIRRGVCTIWNVLFVGHTKVRNFVGVFGFGRFQRLQFFLLFLQGPYFSGARHQKASPRRTQEAVWSHLHWSQNRTR